MSPQRSRPSRTQPKKKASSRRSSRFWPSLLLVALPPALAFFWFIAWTRLPGASGSGTVHLVVIRTETSPSLGVQLHNADLIKQPSLFDIYMLMIGESDSWFPGTHLLKKGMTPRELGACLTRAAARPKVQITIPEGFDQFRIARRLESFGICRAEAFLAAASSPELLGELEIKGATAEGFMFPLTYSLAVDSEPRELIENWVQEARTRIERLNQEHAQGFERLKKDRGWGELELLTMASVIEKETPHDDERPIIASVFFNRLDDPEFHPRRMLQSDPTALYGCLVAASQIPSCTGNGGKVGPAMLRDAQNPYNTYKHPGLPPGPIGNPGEASIAAVLAPAHTNFLFFVARNGRHVFSRNLSEHEAAIRDSSE